jgi:hypothetical protein
MVLVQNDFDREPREPFVEPGSDDFMTFQTRSSAGAFTATEQIEYYDQIRAHGSHLLGFSPRCPLNLRAISVVAIKILFLLGISTSVERPFSAARQICSDCPMAMKQEIIAARTMIQVNWSVARRLSRDVLVTERRGWTRISRQRAERRAEQNDLSRSDISGETEKDPGDSRCDRSMRKSRIIHQMIDFSDAPEIDNGAELMRVQNHFISNRPQRTRDLR